MKVISLIGGIKNALAPIRDKKMRIGFVPTMGALHEGHLSLMKAAKRDCDYVVVSIFVNPLQFGPTEDFKRYPRDLAQDKKMVDACGVDLLFIPSAEEIVPNDLETTVTVGKLARRWEGATRPGHFQGVATIVAKLFQIVNPRVAYFGRKDYQQTVVIQKMVKDLHFDLTLRVLPTVREKDGLAKSSRNQFLSPIERREATVLYRALCRAKTCLKKGERDCQLLRKEVESALKLRPRVAIDYIAFCNPKTLEPVNRITERTVLLLAARVGSVRLIDNIILSS